MAELYPEAAANLASGSPYQDYQRTKRPLLSDPLAVRKLRQHGLLQISNSFLFVASYKKHKPSETCRAVAKPC